MKYLYGDLGASHPLWPDEVCNDGIVFCTRG